MDGTVIDQQGKRPKWDPLGIEGKIKFRSEYSFGRQLVEVNVMIERLWHTYHAHSFERNQRTVDRIRILEKQKKVLEKLIRENGDKRPREAIEWDIAERIRCRDIDPIKCDQNMAYHARLLSELQNELDLS